MTLGFPGVCVVFLDSRLYLLRSVLCPSSLSRGVLSVLFLVPVRVVWERGRLRKQARSARSFPLGVAFAVSHGFGLSFVRLHFPVSRVVSALVSLLPHLLFSKKLCSLCVVLFFSCCGHLFTL